MLCSYVRMTGPDHTIPTKPYHTDTSPLMMMMWMMLTFHAAVDCIMCCGSSLFGARICSDIENAWKP